MARMKILDMWDHLIKTCHRRLQKRVRKIWSGKLSAYNKRIAYNIFALPVLTPTSGIICCTIQEI